MVYIFCEENRTLTKWSGRLQEKCCYLVEFEEDALPTALSCFLDTEDVIVGYKDGLVSIYDECGTCKVQLHLPDNSEVSVVHGSSMYLLVGQSSGRCRYYKLENIELAERYTLRSINQNPAASVVGGGVCYNSEAADPNKRWLIIAGTSDGKYYFQFPEISSEQSSVYSVDVIDARVYIFEVSRHGLIMYAASENLMLWCRAQSSLGTPLDSSSFTPVGNVSAIAVAVT